MERAEILAIKRPQGQAPTNIGRLYQHSNHASPLWQSLSQTNKTHTHTHTRARARARRARATKKINK
jgi:hypothetical protein